MPINKYGEIEVFHDEIRYSYSVAQSEIESREEVESMYKSAMKEISDTTHFLVADRIEMTEDRIIFVFKVNGLEGYNRLRAIPFDKQLSYFKSLTKVVNQKTDILLHPLNLLIDKQEQEIKTYIIGFEKVPIVIQQDNLESLRELILIAMTNRTSILGKPSKSDFIDQSEEVISFAENLLRCQTVEEVQVLIIEEMLRLEQAKKNTKLIFNKLPFEKLSISSLNKLKSIPLSKKKLKKQPIVNIKQHILFAALTLSICSNVFLMQKHVQPAFASYTEKQQQIGTEKNLKEQLDIAKEQHKQLQEENEKKEHKIKELMDQLKKLPNGAQGGNS